METCVRYKMSALIFWGLCGFFYLEEWGPIGRITGLIVAVLMGKVMLYILGVITMAFFRIFGFKKEDLRERHRNWCRIVFGATLLCFWFLTSLVFFELFGFSRETVSIALLLASLRGLLLDFFCGSRDELTRFRQSDEMANDNSSAVTVMVSQILHQYIRKNGVKGCIPRHVANIVLADAICKNEICPISNNPIVKETAAVTSCGHVFCKDAIDRWFSIKDECPVCKQKCT